MSLDQHYSAPSAGETKQGLGAPHVQRACRERRAPASDFASWTKMRQTRPQYQDYLVVRESLREEGRVPEAFHYEAV